MASHAQVSSRTVWVIAFNVLAIAAVTWVAWNTWFALSWILIALFLALALEPLVRLISRRTGMRHGAAVAVVFLLLVGTVVVLVRSIVPMLADQIGTLVHNAPGYVEQLKRHHWLAWADHRFDLFSRVEARLGVLGSAAAGPIFDFVKGALGMVAATITVFSLTLFMSLWGKALFSTALQWFPPDRRPRMEAMVARMTSAVGGYISGTFFISIMGGVVTAVTLLLLGVPYFVPLGLTMVLLGVIPWLGSLLGAVLVVSATLATAGPKKGLIALVIFLVWQQVENRITPLVQARTIKMNPLLVAMVMLVGTAIAGLLGAVLSIPIAGAAQVVLQDLLYRRQARWQSADRPRYREGNGTARQLELFDREQPPLLH